MLCTHQTTASFILDVFLAVCVSVCVCVHVCLCMCMLCGESTVHTEHIAFLLVLGGVGRSFVVVVLIQCLPFS